METKKDNFFTRIFKLNERNTSLTNELYSGLMLFLTVFFTIYFVSNILKVSFTDSEYLLVLPALFLVIGLTSGFLTILSGLITNMPFVIVPNILFSLIITLTGHFFLGYSLKLILISAFIASFFYVITSFVFKKDKLIALIPGFLKNTFTLIFGLFIIFFGLLYSKIITLNQLPDAATTVTSNIKTISFNFPLSIGNILNPIPLLTIIGLCVFIFLHMQKKNKNAFLITFIILFFLGLFFPVVWNKLSYTPKITSFSPLFIRKEGFQILFSNITLQNFQLNIPAFIQFKNILKSSSSLLLLSLTFYISLLYFNIHNIFSLLNISNEGKETNYNNNYNKLTKFSSISSLFGILTNTTFYTYAYESVFSFFNNGKTGLTAVFCGIMIIVYSLFAQFRYFISPSATSFAIICIGIFVLENSIKKITFNNMEEFFPATLMVIISAITFNPIEGLLIGFSTYSIISIIKTISGKESKLNWFMFVSLIITIIYFLIKIF